MAIFAPSSSFMRYLVLEDIPESFNEEFTESIRKNTFVELDENSEEEKSVGWVSLGNITGTKTVSSDFLRQEYIALSLRIDTKKVPGPILKTASLREENRIKELTKRDKLSSAEKKEIRENIKQKLIKRTFPNTALFEVCWNINEKKVWFSSSSENACVEFTELFNATFGLHLRQLFPYTIALGFPFSEEKTQRIDNTFPCDLRYMEL